MIKAAPNFVILQPLEETPRGKFQIPISSELLRGGVVDVGEGIDFTRTNDTVFFIGPSVDVPNDKGVKLILVHKDQIRAVERTENTD